MAWKHSAWLRKAMSAWRKLTQNADENSESFCRFFFRILSASAREFVAASGAKSIPWVMRSNLSSFMRSGLAMTSQPSRDWLIHHLDVLVALQCYLA